MVAMTWDESESSEKEQWLDQAHTVGYGTNGLYPLTYRLHIHHHSITLLDALECLPPPLQILDVTMAMFYVELKPYDVV